MKSYEIFTKTLESENTDIIYIQPGSQILPLTSNLYGSQKIRKVGVINEANGAVMADVSARILHRPIPILTTAGPGSTNIITPFAQAYTANSPLIHISATLPENSPIEAFHGVDNPRFLEKIFDNVAKRSILVSSEEMLESSIIDAYNISMADRKGPVHIGIIDSIISSKADVTYKGLKPVKQNKTYKEYGTTFKLIADTVVRSQPFVAFVGKGVERDSAFSELTEFIHRTNSFVITPRHYPDSFNGEDPRYCGSVGQFSNPMAMMVLQNVDLVICIGILPDSMEDRWLYKHFSGEVLYISQSGTELENSKGLFGNIKIILKDLLEGMSISKNWTKSDQMMKLLRSREIIYGNLDKSNKIKLAGIRTPTVNPYIIMDAINRLLDSNTIIIGDAGSAGGAWINDCIKFKFPGQFLHSRNYDSMGFAVPGSIGASLVLPDSNIIAVTGDGSFLSGMSDLGMINQHDLSPIIIVFNDSSFGMIKQEQAELGNKFIATDLPSVNYADIAMAMGINGVRISDGSDIYSIIKKAINSHEGTVIDIPTPWNELPPSRAYWDKAGINSV